MSETKPGLALDMYVLAQGVKTGVYRVCDELFPRLARSRHFDTRLFIREGDESKADAYILERDLVGRPLQRGAGPSTQVDVLLSPFGVAPSRWLTDERVLHAHIVYDLIAIHRPDYFSAEASREVREIMASLTEETVIFAISEHTKRELLAYRPDLGPGQITVIPLAVAEWFKPCMDPVQRAGARMKYGIPPGVPYVLSLATLEIRKNLDQVVNAFVLYLEQHQDDQMHLVLAGMSGWKLEKLEHALAASGRWRNRILLTGFVEDPDLAALYSDALCFVYLSRYEGFGLPPLEAMACGTPVICADNSSLPEVVGDAGVILDADDVQGVADAVRRMATSDAYRKELSVTGIERARSFDWDRCTRIVEDTLVEAYRRHAARPAHLRRRSPTHAASLEAAGSVETLNQASFFGYRNGSRGPTFSEFQANAGLRADFEWPTWSDRLPAPVPAVSGRAEGGLRTVGRLKSGTASKPLVSYVTVVRNNTATLARTIQSVQQQTYQNVEHIVLDGASTDGTLDLIRQYANSLDYFVSEPDRGLYDAINKAVPLARGQLICILNSDDWLEPHAAEIAVHRMRVVCNEPALLMTAARVREGDITHEWLPAFVHPGSYFTCANDCHNGIYATRSAYERSGPYDSSFKIAADFKWIMSCLESGATFIYTREPTVNYSLGGTSSDIRSHSIECMRIVSDRFAFLTPAEVSGLYHIFFLLAGPFAAQQEGRPANYTQFLRWLFARHEGRRDFLNALTWASMATLVHPEDAASAPPPTFRWSLKELAKKVLRVHPGLYGVAARGYRRLRG